MRQVAQNGMKTEFRKPENLFFRSLIRSAMALPFVPLKKMEAAMQILEDIAGKLEDKKQIEFSKKFIAYIHRQWIREYDYDFMAMWNFFSKKGAYTNNIRYY